MDTPETVHPDKPVQRFGPEATLANSAWVENQIIYLEKDVSETDKYGRLLRHVWVPFLDGPTLVSVLLVLDGFAQISTYPPDVKYQNLLLQAQQLAREAGRGIWGD